MTVPLHPQQWELGGVRFGLGTGVEVADFDPGTPDIETGDVDHPGEDGIVFGRDYWGGRTLTFEMFTARQWDAQSAREKWRELARVWDARRIRTRAGRVMPLRMRLPGGDEIIVYGRPRSFEADGAGQLRHGHVEMLATFTAADPLFYSATEASASFSLVASGGGGITWPVRWPIRWSASGERQDVVRNAGDMPTWPIIAIRGPVAQPEIGYVETGVAVRLDTDIAYDQSITIDTRPWVRTVLRADGASTAGALRGARMSDLQLPVGQTTVRYSGTDMSGQSTASISWRSAYTTP